MATPFIVSLLKMQCVEFVANLPCVRLRQKRMGREPSRHLLRLCFEPFSKEGYEVKFRAGIFLGVIAVGALLLTACTRDSGTTVVSSSGAEGINVNGQGIAYGSPDVADVDIGVQVPAPTVAEAREKAAVAMDAVIKSVKGNGVADADVRTSQFSVDPQYSYPPGTNPYQGGSQTITGYQVTNVVTVRIRKLDTVAKIVDEASAAGGNSTVVRRMAYGILDQKKLQTQARDLAVKEAKARADELASLNGVKAGKALQINESTSALPPQPYYYSGAAPVVTAPRTGDTSTSIESGQLSVVVRVTINYEIE
jgi:uncharacterized protein YggE